MLGKCSATKSVPIINITIITIIITTVTTILCIFETESLCVVQAILELYMLSPAGLELIEILLLCLLCLSHHICPSP